MARHGPSVQIDAIEEEVVGVARFELATYGTQNRRATKLRHTPMARPLQGKRRGCKGA